MSGVKITVRSNSWKERAKNYLDHINVASEEATAEITQMMLEEAALAAPTPDEEFSLIMYGEEGMPAPTNKIRNYSERKRVRFIREPGMWLQQAIRDPSTYEINGKIARIGNVTALNAITHFSWTDASHQAGIFTYTSEYGMFSLFEFGSNVLGMGRVKPSHETGHEYFLSVSELTRVPEYDKTISPRGMFTHINTSLISKAYKDKLREVQF